MSKVKIKETYSNSNGVYVYWDIIKDGKIIASPKVNFHPLMSKNDIYKGIAEHSEEIIDNIENPPIPPTLGDVIDQEIDIETLKPPRTLEVIQVEKVDEIDQSIDLFIRRKSDGNVRYNLLGLIAMVASTIGILEQLHNGNPTEEESAILNTRLQKIQDIWKWIEQVFIRRVKTKQIITTETSPESIESLSIPLTDLEIYDPDITLEEVWYRIPDTE
jgi:hypothetical protein